MLSSLDSATIFQKIVAESSFVTLWIRTETFTKKRFPALRHLEMQPLSRNEFSALNFSWSGSSITTMYVIYIILLIWLVQHVILQLSAERHDPQSSSLIRKWINCMHLDQTIDQAPQQVVRWPANARNQTEMLNYWWQMLTKPNHVTSLHAFWK
jgi:hypothetical protein